MKQQALAHEQAVASLKLQAEDLAKEKESLQVSHQKSCLLRGPSSQPDSGRCSTTVARWSYSAFVQLDCEASVHALIYVGAFS